MDSTEGGWVDVSITAGATGTFQSATGTVFRGNITIGTKGTILTNINHAGFTLTANATTTTVTNTAVQADSRIFFSPISATAAVVVGSATGVWVSDRTAGVSFTLTHPNTADADKAFSYLIINP
jgi:hypothetical protein